MTLVLVQTAQTVIGASNGGTNWDLVFVGVTAVATFALALATFYLALGTRKTASSTEGLARETRKLVELTESEVGAVLRQVEVSGEQVAIARQDVSVSRAAHEGTVRPVLVNVPSGLFPIVDSAFVNVPGTTLGRPTIDQAEVIVEEVGNVLFVTVPARNAGAGIAFLFGASMRWRDPLVQWGGQVSTVALPPGEVVRASFSIPPEQHGRPAEVVAPTLLALLEYGLFSVEIHYSELAGNMWSSRFHLTYDEPRIRWTVEGVVLGHEGRTDEVGSPLLEDSDAFSTGPLA